MKITEFVLTHNIPRGFILKDLFAQVSVTTGMLWWKKVERKTVVKTAYSVFWVWADSGKFTPGFRVEELARAYEAQETLAASTTKEQA